MQVKKENNMKVKIWAPASLVALALFAISTPAQMTQAQLAEKYPTKAHPAKTVSDASAAGKSQTKRTSNAITPDATQTCTYKFTSGSGTTYLQFCVTVNGNIVEFDSPSDVEQIDQGSSPDEGYGICDDTTETQYYDYGYEDSSNWNPATKVSSTATSVKIERTTSDGAWTLTQTITSSAGTNPYAKIAMALKNNSSVSKEAQLIRYANANPDYGYPYEENYDGSEDSVWGYGATGSSSPYGLMLESVGNSAPTTVEVFREGFAISGEDGPNPCDSGLNFESPITDATGSLVYFYDLALNKEQTGTVTLRYISF
jgi:hypothetical protein